MVSRSQLFGLLGLLGLQRCLAREVLMNVTDSNVLLDQYFTQANDITYCNMTYFTTTPGSQGLITFTGTGVALDGSRSSRGGVYDVYLDDVKQATVDRYAASSKLLCPTEMFNQQGLPNQQHILRVVLVANSTSRLVDSGAGYVDISAIRYTVPDEVTTTYEDMSSSQSATAAVQTGSPTTVPAPKKSTPVGAIAGGVVGGIVALCILGFLIWFLRKRSKKTTAQVGANLADEGEKGDVIVHRYPIPPGTQGYQPDLAYRSTSPGTNYPAEPFDWSQSSRVGGESSTMISPMTVVNTGLTRPLPQAPGSSSSYPSEKSPISPITPITPSPPRMARMSVARSDMDSAAAGVSSQPLSNDDVQRIAQAVLAHGGGAQPYDTGASPPQYQ